MYKKLSQLSFVIGLFFTIVSLILLTNTLVNRTGARLNIFTGIVFLVFGLLMIYLSNKENRDE